MRDLFGSNKRKVRDMDTILIDRYLNNADGSLRYLGLPASTLSDVILWRDKFSHFSAIERGREEDPFVYQHDLVLTALRSGLSNKLRLYRGDIDDILLKGADEFGNALEYPYHVVSLDYSGGVLYKDAQGNSKRVNSIQNLIKMQASHQVNFLLFLSFNLRGLDHGEIREVIKGIGHELGKLGLNTEAGIDQYLNHPLEEARLKLYVPYLIRQYCSGWYQSEYFKPIFYLGNRDTRMMHFAVWLKRAKGLSAGKLSKQTYLHLWDLTAFECIDGKLHETNFDIEVNKNEQ